jgi:gas vesicle protein
LAQEIKAKIDDWLKANDKLSREMRETMKREHAAIKDTIAREVDKGLDAESPSIKTLNEVLEALSKSLGSGH